jgi:hypothetical protein
VTPNLLRDLTPNLLRGCFVATTVLCAAFVEHWLAGNLEAIGVAKEAGQGLASMLGCCKKYNFLNQLILTRIERLRTVRNPFVHLKAFDHPHTIGQRTLRQRRHPFSVMEEDAKESLITMYAVATTRFSKRKGS